MKAQAHLRSFLYVLTLIVVLGTALQPLSSFGADSGKAGSRTENPSVITIQVHPLNAPVTSMVTQQFTVAVGGNSNHAVTWYVDGVLGGNATSGTISATGLYTPPTTFVVGTHTVTAVSQANPNYSGSATVYLTAYAGQFTNKNDTSRTGQNLQETILTPENVNVSTFGKLFSFEVSGSLAAEPLYVANVNIPSPLNGSAGYHNVIYVATQGDGVYAFDADGKVTAPLWQDNFTSPPTVTTVPGSCLYVIGQQGIGSTPVIDPNTNTLYVDVRTLENATSQCVGTYVHRLHALDITTGEEKFGGPVVVQAQVQGTGTGSVDGTLAFSPEWENARPGLLESQSSQDPNPVIYMATASLDDTEPWHGWVLGFDSQTLQLVYTYCTTADGWGGGVWQKGSGLAADAAGNIYLQTGNGTFDDVDDFGVSVLKLAPNNGSLVLIDSYTPSDYSLLDQQDWDVSSGGILLLPPQPGNYPNLMVGGGKEGTIYVMNQDDLGGYTAGQNNIVQYIVGAILPSVKNGAVNGIWGAPSYFNGNVYIFGQNDYPKMFTLNNGQMPTTATSIGSTTMMGPTPVVSANGSSNGIIWALQYEVPELWAFDPNDLTQVYYDTEQDPSRDQVASGKVTRTPPTIANGRVYVPSNGLVKVYGLLQ
jgi:hypothetical protein